MGNLFRIAAYDEDIMQRKSPGKDEKSGPKPDTSTVKVSGLDIPFFDLVWLMVKLSFAAIPAAIIIAMLWTFLIELLAGLT